MSKRYDLNVTIEDYLKTFPVKQLNCLLLSRFIGAYESGASLRLANQAKNDWSIHRVSISNHGRYP